MIKRRSRILLSIGAYPPAHSGGGLRIHRTYKQILEYMPIDLTVVTHRQADQATGWSEHEDVPVLSVAPDIKAFSFLRTCGSLALANRLKPYDLVHVMGQSNISWKIMAAARWLRIPTIFEFTLVPQPAPPSDRGTRRKRRFLPNARLAIALNQRIEEYYLSYGVAAERIWQRPNPVRTELFRPPTVAERQQARAELKLGADDLMLFFLARFQPRKNQLLALDALSHLPPHYKLVLAGPVLPEDQPYYAEMQRIIADRDLAHRVTVIAEQIEQVLPLYHAADCCWLTSLKEGLPNVMLESLCAGVPVLANQDLGLTAYIRDGNNGRNAAPSPSAFAQATLDLEPLLRDSDRRNSIATEARNKFDATRLNREFAARLGRLLGWQEDNSMATAMGDNKRRTEARM